MRVPDGIASRAYLLAYDPDRERLAGRMWLAYMLRGAALADLLARAAIRDDAGRAVAVPGARLPADPPLRALYAEIAGDQKPHRWESLVKRNRSRTGTEVRAGLENAGWIRVTREPRWWRAADIEIADPRVLTRLSERVAATLRSPLPMARIPEPDRLLIAVLAATGQRTGISKEQQREYAQRIADAIDLGGAPIAGLRKAIQQARSSMS